jgi:hypothetical protein
MQPPKDVPPSELFLKLCEPQPSEVIDFPRKGLDGKPVGQVRIQVLTMEDHVRARLDAHQKLKTAGLTEDDLRGDAPREVLNDEAGMHVLAKACLTPETPVKDEHGNPVYGRVFRDASELRKLRAPEIDVLWAAYQMVQAKYGPYEKLIADDADLDAWIRRLVEGASQFPLARLPSQRWGELISSLVARICTLYADLASQRSNLPPTLASRLDAFCTDTGWYGGPAAESTPTGGDGSTDAVTTEQAARVAEELMG